MKKLLILLLVLTVSAALFASGGGQAASGGGAAQPKEIRIMLANHPYGDLLKGDLAEFEKQSGIKLNMEQLNETQLNQKLTTEFASNASSVDVFMTRPLQETLLFLKNNWLAPLNAYDFSDYPANTVDLGRKDGKAHVVPLIVEWQVLYYRKDLLQAAGIKVPTTFDELEAAAKALTKDGVAGFASRGAASPGVTQLSSYIYNFGGLYLDKGMAVFDTPQAVEAIRLYGRLNGTYGPQGIGAMSWDQIMPIFQAGRVAMWTDASVFLGQVLANTQIPKENIGVAKLPAGPKADKPFYVVPWGMSIYSKTKDMDSAMKFLNWATSKEFAIKGMALNIPMNRNSAWADTKVTGAMDPGIISSKAHAAANGFPLDRPFMTGVVQARDLIGELITESINTKGTSTRLEALAKEKAGQVNDLLKADGEYGK